MHGARVVDLRHVVAAGRPGEEPGLGLRVPATHEPVFPGGIGDRVALGGEQAAGDLVFLGDADERVRRLGIPRRREIGGVQHAEEHAAAQHAHQDGHRPDRAAHRRLGHHLVEPGFLGDVGKHRARGSVGAVDGGEMALAEQQRHAVLHHDAAERVAHRGTTRAQRDVLAAGARAPRGTGRAARRRACRPARGAGCPACGRAPGSPHPWG